MTRRVVLRKIPCGGWRRPYDALVRSAENLIFAYCKDGEIHVISHGTQTLQFPHTGDSQTLGGNPLVTDPGPPRVPPNPTTDGLEQVSQALPLTAGHPLEVTQQRDTAGVNADVSATTGDGGRIGFQATPSGVPGRAREEAQQSQSANVDDAGALTRDGGKFGSGAPLSGMAGPRTLNLIHHGREVHCVAILGPPTISGNVSQGRTSDGGASTGNASHSPTLDVGTSTCTAKDNAGLGPAFGVGGRECATSDQPDEADERVGAGASTSGNPLEFSEPPRDRRNPDVFTQGDAADSKPVQFSARSDGERSHGPFPTLVSLTGGSSGSSSACKKNGNMPRVAGPLAIFTGSEDGTLRRMMLRCPSAEPPVHNFSSVTTGTPASCTADVAVQCSQGTAGIPAVSPGDEAVQANACGTACPPAGAPQDQAVQYRPLCTANAGPSPPAGQEGEVSASCTSSLGGHLGGGDGGSGSADLRSTSSCQAASADLQARGSYQAASDDLQARGGCQAAFGGSQPLHDSVLVGEHPAGSVVRAMAVVALPSNHTGVPPPHDIRKCTFDVEGNGCCGFAPK